MALTDHLRPPVRRPGNDRLCGPLVAVMIVWCASFVGCGRRGLSGTIPVEGRVTFAGGGCPAAGCVFFVPLANPAEAAGTRQRSGWARFEQDGGYRVTTLVQGDGLLPGTYAVRVDCHAAGGGDGPTGHDTGASLVPDAVALPPLLVPAGARGPIRHDIDIIARAGENPARSGAGG